MATNKNTTWGSRSKRTSVIALGLVAILAGVAVAYFLKSQKFTNNKAVGGQLTVDATLPLNFEDTPLYPTDAADGGEAAVAKVFTLTNNNTVAVDYKMFATCEECIPDPAVDTTPDAQKARQDKIDQFNDLMVEISVDGYTCPTFDPTKNPDPNLLVGNNCKSYIYQGKLSAMGPNNKQDLGKVADGDSQDYEVRLWLQNDPNNEQPQQVENIWEFFIDAKTPTA
jgi:hypothetical protein